MGDIFLKIGFIIMGMMGLAFIALMFLIIFGCMFDSIIDSLKKKKWMEVIFGFVFFIGMISIVLGVAFHIFGI